MMMMPAQSALWLLPFVTPLALIAAWSEMKWMKIHNWTVLALVAVYAIVGFFALSLSSWAWGWASLAVVLVLGFVLSTVGLIGAGDAKFMAAMAPFVALGDLSMFLMLLAAVVVVSFVAHRLARRSTTVQGWAPHWESWHRREFPMGLALGPSLLFYLCLASIFGTRVG